MKIALLVFRKKLAARLQTSEETIEASNAKCASLEKTKHRLQTEIEDLMVDLERSNAVAAALDKKQRNFDKVSTNFIWITPIYSFKPQVESKNVLTFLCWLLPRSFLNGGRSLRRHSQSWTALKKSPAVLAQNSSSWKTLMKKHLISWRRSKERTKTFKVQTIKDSTVLGGLKLYFGDRKWDKPACIFFVEEITDLTEQIGQDNKAIHELEKVKKTLDLEKSDIHAALEEAEVI